MVPSTGIVAVASRGCRCAASFTTTTSLDWHRRTGQKAERPPYRRSHMTESVDPPANVTERPGTLILAEDSNLGMLVDFNSNSNNNNLPTRSLSWYSLFTQQFPVRYGIPVAKWALSASSLSFDDALNEMKTDFRSSSLSQPILVARGPWVCWLAQFYLESLPLAALVLVDPLPFGTNTEACRMYENLHQSHVSATANTAAASTNTAASDDNNQTHPLEYRLFQDYVQHSEHWTLRLEPAAVPTLVLSTLPSWYTYAVDTAARHSDGLTQRETMVPVQRVHNDPDDVMTTIGQWILREDIL